MPAKINALKVTVSCWEKLNWNRDWHLFDDIWRNVLFKMAAKRKKLDCGNDLKIIRVDSKGLDYGLTTDVDVFLYIHGLT